MIRAFRIGYIFFIVIHNLYHCCAFSTGIVQLLQAPWLKIGFSLENHDSREGALRALRESRGTEISINGIEFFALMNGTNRSDFT